MPRIKPPRNQETIPEPQDLTPVTEEIEITLDGDEPLEAQPEPQHQEPVQDEDALARAAADSRRAEELQRQAFEAQRQRDEALRQVHDERRRNQELEERSQEAEYHAVLTSIASEQTALEKAEADYAAFAQAGDWGNAAKAQRAMATASTRLDRFEDSKRTFDARRETQPTAPVRQTEAPADMIEAQISKMPVPESAKSWLRGHKEYMSDQRKNAKLQAAHWDALDEAGGSMDSPKYIEALESKLGLRQEARQTEVEPQQRNIPMRAPVSRDVPNSSGNRTNGNKITLTPEEREIARNSFGALPGQPVLTNEEKERLYAQNKLRLQRMRANGEYRQTTEQNG